MAEKARAPPHYTGPQSCTTPPTRLKSRATTTRDTPPRREKRGLLYQLPSSNPHKNRIAPTTTKKTNSITKPKHVGPLKHSRYDKGELQKGKPVKIHKKNFSKSPNPNTPSLPAARKDNSPRERMHRTGSRRIPQTAVRCCTETEGNPPTTNPKSQTLRDLPQANPTSTPLDADTTMSDSAINHAHNTNNHLQQ